MSENPSYFPSNPTPPKKILTTVFFLYCLSFVILLLASVDVFETYYFDVVEEIEGEDIETRLVQIFVSTWHCSLSLPNLERCCPCDLLPAKVLPDPAVSEPRVHCYLLYHVRFERPDEEPFYHLLEFGNQH